jgi:hypothetical protein
MLVLRRLAKSTADDAKIHASLKDVLLLAASFGPVQRQKFDAVIAQLGAA